MISEFYKSLEDIWYDYGDPRAQDFLFTRTPYPILITIGIYIFICEVVLPTFFKGKKYPNARYVLVLTYVMQLFSCIVANGYGLYMAYKLKYNLRCEPVTPSFEGYHYKLAVLTYYWVCFKIFEMVESFLVYLLYGVVPTFINIHHILLPLCLTIGSHFYMGGSPLFLGMFYNFDHAFNYTFIALRMYSDDYRRKSDTWFKKYQFLSAMISMFLGLAFFIQLEKRDDCDHTIIKYIAIAIYVTFIILTIYYRANNCKKKKPTTVLVHNTKDQYEKAPKEDIMFDPT
ncbi:hypothetical protein PVAND_012383 [Polypedilum vanderplanki]|uniref:Very-long-chain 3-oxoacyl-CoA synthase n=1 Tax=Polypedilum vanderplanki TaxID=319348 RepID=A0A9J6CN89_POLVA|nr:hypothetical protein PVAND_012383 [Polypedilum vanderplanki]